MALTEGYKVLQDRLCWAVQAEKAGNANFDRSGGGSEVLYTGNCVPYLEGANPSHHLKFMDKQYIRIVLFEGQTFVLTITLDEKGEPLVKSMQKLEELSSEAQLLAFGIRGEAGEFVITSME